MLKWTFINPKKGGYIAAKLIYIYIYIYIYVDFMDFKFFIGTKNCHRKMPQEWTVANLVKNIGESEKY